ncbi:MAG TPA: hypothetical protein VLD19_06310, partial [Chitinophagaceae bacterium]|nr:hypothetical protein [Chitinophagaceae bacterium]
MPDFGFPGELASQASLRLYKPDFESSGCAGLAATQKPYWLPRRVSAYTSPTLSQVIVRDSLRPKNLIFITNMSVKRKVPYNHGIFFITFTCHQWLLLIDITNGYDLVYKWFEYLKANGHYIIGYVLMPNHLHVLIGFRNTGKDINTIIGNGKRFMAYGIVTRLRQQNNGLILDRLKDGVTKSDRQRGKLHEVWEDSFDWKECSSRSMIEQKLRYIHENPCRGKWHLAE